MAFVLQNAQAPLELFKKGPALSDAMQFYWNKLPDLVIPNLLVKLLGCNAGHKLWRILLHFRDPDAILMG